jgi:hypothetical protein
MRRVLVLVSAVLLCGTGFAQVTTAIVSGRVTDPSKAVIADAKVVAINAGTNTRYERHTDSGGDYTIASLPPGTYRIEVEKAGFRSIIKPDVVLHIQDALVINFEMALGSAAENITVTGEAAPEIEPTKTEISSLIETQQITNLPTSNRLFTDFALLTPGVATSRTSLGTTITEFEVSQISFGGMRSFSNEIAVDGADFVNTLSGVQRSTPPQDSVDEYRVVNNSFGADFGRAAGGIVNIITKSGTNQFHGSVYEFFQNSATDSRSLLQPPPLPYELRQNQYGGVIGGPIKKDKTFFFVNYEGKRRAESPTYPPDLYNNINLIDSAKAILGLAPEGCTAPLASCTGSNLSYLQSFLKTTNDDWGFARLDHQISNNNRFAIRYNVEDTRALNELVGNTLDSGGIGAPSSGRDLFVRDQSIVATLNSTLSPNLVNTVLGQFARRHYAFPGATGQPYLDIPNDLGMGHNFGIYDAIYESRGQGSESISWVKGKHLAKFGFDGNYLWDSNNYPGFTPERIIMPGLDCLADFADYFATAEGKSARVPTNGTCPLPPGEEGVAFAYFGIALPRSPSFTGGPTLNAANPVNTATWANAYAPSLSSQYAWTINHGYWGLYGEDQWRVTPKFTFNYGLRWDFESGLGEYVNPDYHEFQPRVGLAYSPDTKTVIRAGFGMFDDRYNLSFFFVPANQKSVPGYLCNPPSAVSGNACAGLPGQMLPMLQASQANAGWQLLGFPGNAAPVPASVYAAGVLETGAFGIVPKGNYGTLPANFGQISLIGTCFTTGACGVGIGGMDHKANPFPYAEQASLEVDRQFGGGFALNVAYLFAAGHRLVRGNNLNVPCPIGTTKTSNQQIEPGPVPGAPFAVPGSVPGWVNADGTLSPCLGTPTLGAPGTAFAGMGPWFVGALGSGLQTVSAGLWDYNNGVANVAYNGLTVTALERWGKYLNLNANYTYSHTIDNGNFTTFINLPPNQFDFSSERGNSNQDLRHRFVTNFTLTAPEHSFVRNFQFSSIITLQSGRPFTLYVGQDVLNDLAGSNTDRVFVGGQCPTVTNCSTMIGRNTYFGDALYSWDLRLTRIFRLTERVGMNLSVDAFDVLNRQNIDEVNSVYGSPVICGAIPHNYNDAASLAIQNGTATCNPAFVGLQITPAGNAVGIPPSPNAVFGTPRTMLNPRQFQFAARFTF